MATIQTQGYTLDNSGQRIVVDPITRIEGHLRIDVEVAGRLDAQIEGAMPGRELEHVIEKADAGADLVPSAAVEAG